jgi:hypothetical protein
MSLSDASRLFTPPKSAVLLGMTRRGPKFQEQAVGASALWAVAVSVLIPSTIRAKSPLIASQRTPSNTHAWLVMWSLDNQTSNL